MNNFIPLTLNISKTSRMSLLNTITRSVTYKSAISLERLYPSSNLNLTTPTKPLTSSCEKFSGYIPLEKINITYSKSSGPGGQNINKVNTKVDVRFHVDSADWIDKNIRNKLTEKFKNKITADGFMVFRSHLTRYQQLNLADCLEKIRCAIREASYEKPPISEATLEKIRQRKDKAARERLILKRSKSDIKESRQGPNLRDLM